MTGFSISLRKWALAFAVMACGAASAQTAPPAAAAPAAVAPAKAAPASSAAVTARPVLVPGKPLWKDLSPPQQVALDPLKAEWDHMDSARKPKWLDIANRYAAMKPDEQQRMQERMRAWLKLTPEQRRLARENYTLSKKIGKDQKTAQWEQYQQLSEEEKKKLAADATSNKKVTNLPPKTQPKAVAPLKPAPGKAALCTGGQVKNTNPAGPACISAPTAVPAPATTPAPGNPAVPVPNAK